MQLGKKSKTNNAFESIKDEYGPETEIAAPVAAAPKASTPSAAAASTSSTAAIHKESVHISIEETITASASREGTLESFVVKGMMQLQISDAALTNIRLALELGDIKGVTLMSHPKVDKTAFRNQNIVQTSTGFPKNQSLSVVRWTLSPKSVADFPDPPISFNVWVNDAGSGNWNITVEYEWNGPEPLKDVIISIPYQTSEPQVSSHDAVYEVSGDTLDWTIGTIDESNANGTFEYEAQAADESEFFPMGVQFSRNKPFIEIDVS
jgi:hypothetical protein